MVDIPKLQLQWESHDQLWDFAVPNFETSLNMRS